MTAMWRPNSFSNRRGLELRILDQVQLDPRRDFKPGRLRGDVAGPGCRLPAEHIPEEICRSSHVAGRQSDVCQSHGIGPRQLLGCELLEPFLIILNNRNTRVDYRVARGNDDHAKSRRETRLGSHCGSVWQLLPPLVRCGETQAAPSLEHDILPLLKARCQKCHGPVKPKGKLNLSSARSLARGGESGPVVVPGNLDESLIWDQVSNDEMPPRPGEPLIGG